MTKSNRFVHGMYSNIGKNATTQILMCYNFWTDSVLNVTRKNELLSIFDAKNSMFQFNESLSKKKKKTNNILKKSIMIKAKNDTLKMTG